MPFSVGVVWPLFKIEELRTPQALVDIQAARKHIKADEALDLTILTTTFNGRPLAKQQGELRIKGSDGSHISFALTTDEAGQSKVQISPGMLSSGQHKVAVTIQDPNGRRIKDELSIHVGSIPEISRSINLKHRWFSSSEPITATIASR